MHSQLQQIAQTLEHAENIKPNDIIRHMQPVLRLWEYPAFDHWKSWTVLFSRAEGGQNPEVIARQATWMVHTDEERGFFPIPGLQNEPVSESALRLRDDRCAYPEIAALIEEGKGLAVPLVGIGRPLGLDGVTYGIAAPYVFRLEWWGNGPAEWEPIMQWAEKVRAYLIRP